MAARTPPRFVPTLTTIIDVVPDADAAPETPTLIATEAKVSGARIDVEDGALAEELMQRVLERVDRSLENQISDVVAAEVQAQLDLMVPRLRSEIEKVLRRLVNDALGRESPSNPGSTLV
ncbi:MAG: hypothetical protein ACRYGA_04220 [Janthinobacterium lividum]